MFRHGRTEILMLQVFVIVLLVYVGGGAYYVYSQSSQPLGRSFRLTPTAEVVALRPAAPTQVALAVQEAAATRTPTPSPTATTRPASATPAASPAISSPAISPTSQLPANAVEYTVQTGDNLGSIARAYGITVDDLLAANPSLRDKPDSLAVGQVLAIPAATGGPAATPTPPPWVTYVVEEGDTLDAIAERFGVTADSIIRANALQDPDAIKPGDRLLIPIG